MPACLPGTATTSVRFVYLPGKSGNHGHIRARHYEGHEQVEISDTSLTIGGKSQPTYTFPQDYYFMMGDKRHNSEDSRFWGFVPEDHIVGKLVFIWLSLDSKANFFNRIRWKRLFQRIH